jgi:hypothetical protein
MCHDCLIWEENWRCYAALISTMIPCYAKRRTSHAISCNEEHHNVHDTRSLMMAVIKSKCVNLRAIILPVTVLTVPHSCD